MKERNQGHGLGIQFLKHVERNPVLAHLVDVSDATGRDPVEDFEIVMRELASFSEELAANAHAGGSTKMDAAQDPERVKALRRLARKRGLPFAPSPGAPAKGCPNSSEPWRKPYSGNRKITRLPGDDPVSVRVRGRAQSRCQPSAVENLLRLASLSTDWR